MTKIKAFVPGDVVVLMSGGPQMTVEGLREPLDNDVVDVVVDVEWFDLNQQVQTYTFYSKQLKKVEQA